MTNTIQPAPATFAEFRALLATTPLPTARTFEAFDAMKLRLKLADPQFVEWSDGERVVRWRSNGAVVPDFVLLQDAGIAPWAEQIEARRIEADAAIEAYRASQAALSPEARAERSAEARAEFGPDAVVVDVITGEAISL